MRAIKKTKFQKHKTFSNDSAAKAYVEKYSPLYPGRKFFIKKRKFPGKLKIRFTVQSR